MQNTMASQVLILCIIAFSSFVIIGAKSERKTNLNAVAHNLTYPIDKILSDNETSYLEVLEEALKQSSYVFYETDMLLNDIETILPVIALLEDLKPEGSNPQIILSLRCVNYTNGLFLRKRLADMFYDLKSKLSLKNRAKIINHICAITLDFRSKYTSKSYFYQNSKYALTEDISFTKYLKNFIKLHFGDKVIPVGLIYNHELELRNSDYIKTQLSGADFVICYIELNLYTDFPMFRNEFNSVLRRKIDYSGNNGFLKGRGLYKNMTVLIQITDNGKLNDGSLYKYMSNGDYYSTFNRFMSATVHYNTTSQQFLKRTYEKSLSIFNQEIFDWGISTQEEYHLIISNPIQNYEAPTPITIDDESSENKKIFQYIIPSLRTQEVDVNVNEMRTNLSSWRNLHEYLMVDEKTWRTLTRYQQDLENDSDTTDCEPSSSNRFLNGILNFPSGISGVWKDIQNYMTELIYGSSEMANVSLKTLIFDENDIESSAEIQRFLNTSKQLNFSIGCSVSFDKLRRNFYGDALSTSTLKSTLQKNICQPMPDSFDTFVWHISDVDLNYDYDYIKFKTSGLFSTYSDVFLAREIFMKEFNGTNVLIHFSTPRDKRIIAELYEVPIIAPMSQISY